MSLWRRASPNAADTVLPRDAQWLWQSRNTAALWYIGMRWFKGWVRHLNWITQFKGNQDYWAYRNHLTLHRKLLFKRLLCLPNNLISGYCKTVFLLSLNWISMCPCMKSIMKYMPTASAVESTVLYSHGHFQEMESCSIKHLRLYHRLPLPCHFLLRGWHLARQDLAQVQPCRSHLLLARQVRVVPHWKADMIGLVTWRQHTAF